MEAWLQYRHHCAEFLRARAHASGNRAEFDAWERYARQTARMQATAAQLARALGAGFTVANGLRVSHQGREIYLEHLVVGPTGIYLIETAEGDDAQWRHDLAQNIAFFQQALGTQVAYFTCLVVSRAAGLGSLPPGAHLVDSSDIAIDVIRDQRSGLLMPPALAQELWHLLQAVAIREQGQVSPPPAARTTSRLEWATLALPLVYSIVIGLLDSLTGFFAALFVFVLPTGLLWPLIRLIRRESLRRGLMITLLVLALLLFLLLLIGVTADPA